MPYSLWLLLYLFASCKSSWLHVFLATTSEVYTISSNCLHSRSCMASVNRFQSKHIPAHLLHLITYIMFRFRMEHSGQVLFMPNCAFISHSLQVISEPTHAALFMFCLWAEPSCDGACPRLNCNDITVNWLAQERVAMQGTGSERRWHFKRLTLLSILQRCVSLVPSVLLFFFLFLFLSYAPGFLFHSSHR